MRKLRERLLQWLTAGADACPGDRFITVRSNGTAHFDVAAYLASPEGLRELAGSLDAQHQDRASGVS